MIKKMLLLRTQIWFLVALKNFIPSFWSSWFFQKGFYWLSIRPKKANTISLQKHTKIRIRCEWLSDFRARTILTDDSYNCSEEKRNLVYRVLLSRLKQSNQTFFWKHSGHEGTLLFLWKVYAYSPPGRSASASFGNIIKEFRTCLLIWLYVFKWPGEFFVAAVILCWSLGILTKRFQHHTYS